MQQQEKDARSRAVQTAVAVCKQHQHILVTLLNGLETGEVQIAPVAGKGFKSAERVMYASFIIAMWAVQKLDEDKEL